MSRTQSSLTASGTGSAGRAALRRVRIRNYKSIGACDVELAALTALVGRNASGKSNFLDALRFVVDGLRTSLDHALMSRGGIQEVRRRSTGHPRNFSIGFELDLPNYDVARYAFEVAAQRDGGFEVRREHLQVLNSRREPLGEYEVRSGKLERSHPSGFAMPAVACDRLYLVSASGTAPFRSVYDALLSMGFYSLSPDAIRELQSPDAGELLRRDGSNIASVIARLKAGNSRAFERIVEYLPSIVPGVREFDRIPLGPRETLQFRQEVRGSKSPWTFYAASMSDGTLRALGALVAVAQLAERPAPVCLVGIEEPETALHPAASGALVEALREASSHTQIVVTTHSADFLDQLDPQHDAILIVVNREGETSLAPMDRANRQVLADHLYTAGELLRLDQLQADQENIERQSRQLRLFPDETPDAPE